MNPNVLPSSRVALVGVINPDANAAATLTTAWVAMKDFESMLALISAGTLGAAATLDAKLEQATDGSGTGVKDITGKAITQMVKATDDDKETFINLRADELDADGGFDFVRLSITVAVAASDAAAYLFGLDPHYAPASDNDAASVIEIIA